MNKPTVAEFEGKKPPTVSEFETGVQAAADPNKQLDYIENTIPPVNIPGITDPKDITIRSTYQPPEQIRPTEISAWNPAIAERVKIRLSEALKKSPFTEYGKRLGQLGVNYLSSAITGLGLYVPDIITKSISKYDTFNEAMNKITGFLPTPREKGAAKTTEYITGLTTAGRLVGPVIAKIPARQALRIILNAGLNFGARSIAEETSKLITTKEPINWQKIHAEAGIGSLFGIAEAGLGRLADTAEYRRWIKTYPAYKNIPRRLFAKTNEAIRAAQGGMGKKTWAKLYSKDVQSLLTQMRKVSKMPVPVPITGTAQKGLLARPGVRPPVRPKPKLVLDKPVKPPSKPAASLPVPQQHQDSPEFWERLHKRRQEGQSALSQEEEIVVQRLRDESAEYQKALEEFEKTEVDTPERRKFARQASKIEKDIDLQVSQMPIEEIRREVPLTPPPKPITAKEGEIVAPGKVGKGKITVDNAFAEDDRLSETMQDAIYKWGDDNNIYVKYTKSTGGVSEYIEVRPKDEWDDLLKIRISDHAPGKGFADRPQGVAYDIQRDWGKKTILKEITDVLDETASDHDWGLFSKSLRTPTPEAKPTPKPQKVEAPKVEKVKPPTVSEYEAPAMATQAQKAHAHKIAKSKAFVSEKGKMRPGYRALAKAMTGKRSMTKMTEQEAKDFIYALGKLPEPKMKGGRLIPPSIPRTTKLVPEGFFQRRFKRPTPFGLITSNAYYAEKLGVKSLVEPLEKAKMRFDLEHHSAANEIDRMGQKIDRIGKTTAREKLSALRKNVPTKARAEMGDLLDMFEEAPAGLDPKKKEIFNWFRNLSRTILIRQNEARAKLGMPLIKGRKAYMRHIATDISREMLAGKYPFPEGIGFWSGLNTGKKIFNPMEFQRKLEDDVYGLFTRDPVYASKTMMYTALKEIHLNQPLKFFNEQLSALGKDLPEYKNLSLRERAELDKTMVIPADTRRWMIDYVRTVIKGQQTNTDSLVNNIVNESGLRGLLNVALRPFGRVLSQRPVTKFFQAAGRVQMAGVMGPRPRLLIRNKFQLTQNLALYGMKANARAFLPPNKELKKLLDDSLFLKSYTGLEEMPVDLAKKVEKLWHKAYQWTATSNARQAMEVAYWDIKELIDNPKYKKYGWKQEHLLKEMEFGASTTQYQYNAIGMPGIFRHKSLIPATRLTSWWMNYFAKFHREALHRAFTGRPSWSGPEGPTLPWSRRMGWLRYAVLGGLILNTMGYTRSYMFGAAPTGWPPALQAASALYRYAIADDDKKRKMAKSRFYNAVKTFIPGYIAYKDFDAIWTGKKDLKALLFYEKKKKKQGE